MKSWQPHQRLLLFLLLALALTSAISPILTLGADWFMTQSPALVPQRMPFHRTFNRAFMISGIVLFLFFRHGLITTEVKKLFLVGRSDPKILSGVVTRTMIILTGVAVYHLTKRRAARLSDQPHAVMASAFRRYVVRANGSPRRWDGSGRFSAEDR